MTHWWAPFALLAILAVMWLVTVLAHALEDDRGWKWWTAKGLALIPIFGLLFLIDLVVPAWGDGRKFLVVLATWVLASIGEVTHEHRTGKPLIRLPRKS